MLLLSSKQNMMPFVGLNNFENLSIQNQNELRNLMVRAVNRLDMELDGVLKPRTEMLKSLQHA